MPSYVSRDQRGFTLIEMSIVLVIIGLIVGGILKGQEVIESARQKNTAAMVDQIKAAHNTFVDRYRSLPGDFDEGTTKIAAVVANGDRNGFIGSAGGLAAASGAGIAAVNGSTGEFYGYFQGLVAGGLFGGGQVGASSGATVFSGGSTPSPLPATPWSNTGFTVTSGIHQGDAANVSTVLSTTWLRLQGTPLAMTASTTGALTIASAYQMDQKFDDGVAALGRIRNTGVGASGCGGPAAASIYTVAATTNARECDLIFAVP